MLVLRAVWGRKAWAMRGERGGWLCRGMVVWVGRKRQRRGRGGRKTMGGVLKDAFSVFAAFNGGLKVFDLGKTWGGERK